MNLRVRVLGPAVVALLLVAGCAEIPASGVVADPAADAGVVDPGATDPAAPDAAASDPAADPGTVAPVPATGTALASLELLPVKGRAPKTGYDRDLFGAGWLDPDRNGCDTRNDILAAQLTSVVHKDGTNGCVVLSGVLADPYSGTSIPFTRGETTSTAVQIDHVVALSDAWQKGAQQLDEATRQSFANDPLNLIAADGPLNGQKSDGDAATWLPPNKAYRCAYVARQVAVKLTYSLWVTQAEHDAIGGVLAGCPDEPLPSGAVTTPPAGPVAPPADAVVPPEPATTGAYANCAAARAAGAAPVRLGDPGYGTHLDRDGDGDACE